MNKNEKSVDLSQDFVTSDESSDEEISLNSSSNLHSEMMTTTKDLFNEGHKHRHSTPGLGESSIALPQTNTELEMIIEYDDDDETTRALAQPQDLDATIYLDCRSHETQMMPNSMVFESPESNSNSSSNTSAVGINTLTKSKSESADPTITVEELRKSAGEILQTPPVVNRLSSTFRLMQETLNPVILSKQPSSSDNRENLWNLVSNAIERIQDRDIQKDLEPDSSTVSSVTDVEETPFNILNWASLQREIKDNFYIFEAEDKLTDEILQNITTFSGQLLNYNLQIREATERLRYKLRQETWREEDIRKVLIEEPYDILGDAHFEVKKLLNRLFENPKLLATALSNDPDSSKLKLLEATLCNHFFLSPTEDPKIEKDLLRFITELLKIEIQKINKPSELFSGDTFTEKIILAFLRRNECRSYAKRVLKIPVIKIYKESHNIILDPKNIAKLVLRKNEPVGPTKSQPNLSKSNLTTNTTSPVKSQRATLTPASASTPTSNLRNKLQSALPDNFGEISADAINEYARMLKNYYVERQNNHPTLVKEAQRGKGSRSQLYFSNLASSNIKGFDQEKEDPPTFSKKLASPKKLKGTLKTASPLTIKTEELKPPKGDGSALNLINMWKRSPKASDEPKDDSKQQVMDTLMKDPEINKIYQTNVHKVKTYTNSFVSSIFDNFRSIPVSLRILCKIISILLKEKFPNITKKEHDSVFANLLFAKWILPYFLSPEYLEIIDEFQKNRSTAMEVNKMVKRILLQDLFPRNDFLSTFNEYISLFRPSVENYFDQLMDLNMKLVENFISSDNCIKESSSKLQVRLLCASLQDVDTIVKSINKSLKQINEIDPAVGKIAQDLENMQKQQPDLFGAKAHPTTHIKYRPEQVFIHYVESNSLKLCASSYVEEYLKMQNYSRGMTESERILAKCKHIMKQVLLATDDISDISLIAYDDDMTIEGILTFFQDVTDYLYLLFEKKIMLRELILRGFELLKKKLKMHKEITTKRHLAFQRLNIRDLLHDIQMPVCLRCPLNIQGQNKRVTIVNQKDYQAVGLSQSLDPKKKSAYISITTGKESKESEVHAHCFTLSDFVAAFTSLPLVRQSVTGYSIYGDKSGVNDAFCQYLNGVYEIIKENVGNASEDELKVVLQEIENYLTRKIYLKVYPVNDTLIDQAFWSRCKTLEWISFDHLDIPEKNRCMELWEYCSKLFANIDNKLTPTGKLSCMIECFKTIAYVVGLSSTKGDSASADDTLPIFIYVILNAFPRRIYSNLNFINALQRKTTLLAEAGYCLTNVQSTVSFLENIDPSMIKLDKTEFQRMIHDKEVKYELFFLKTRGRISRQKVDLTELRQLYKQNEPQPNQQDQQQEQQEEQKPTELKDQQAQLEHKDQAQAENLVL